MTGKEAQLNKIRSDAAECLLISSLATSEKREIFAKIAEHLNGLAYEFEKTMDLGGANVISAKPPQLEKIRSDAAECLLLSNLANGDKREMFAKTAEHLNSLVFEVENTMAINGARGASAGQHPTAVINDLTTAPDQVAATAGVVPTDHHQAARSYRILPWLLIIVAAPIAGVLLWANGPVEKYLPLHTLRSKQEQSFPAQDSAKSGGPISSEQGIGNAIVDWFGALAAPFGNLEKVLENLKRPNSEPVGSPNKEFAGAEEKTATVTRDLATARRDSETKVAALSSKTDDETVKQRTTAEAATAELQQERQKTAALTRDLATARRDLETKVSSDKGDDEAAQLRKTAEAATAELQQERQKTAALTTDLTIARRDLETKAALSRKANDETAQPRNITEATTAEPQQERQKAAPPDRSAGAVAKSIIAAPGSQQPATSGAKVDAEAAHLIARAKSLLSQGNIVGARIVLERAVEMGSAKASFAIAETYDPRILSHWNVYGTRGDISKAREYYTRAVAGGIEEAKERLTSLYQ
jgi:hypothetical protein